MEKVLRVECYGRIEVSFAVHQVGGPWVSLAGDCFFRHLHQDFSVGPLKIEDCPFTLAFPRSKINDLMTAVEQYLPSTTGLLILHVGANNVASTRFSARSAAVNLLDRCVKLMRSRPHIGEISICLLSPRTVDDHGVYSAEYINHYNEKVAAFNDEIVTHLAHMPRFSYIDFKLEHKNLWFLLRETGFGVNDGGRQTMARTLQAIIIWKRLVGESIRRGEPSTSYVPDRLLNIPFAPQAQFAQQEPFRCTPSVSPPNMSRGHSMDSARSFASEPWLNPLPPPPPRSSSRGTPLLLAPENYSNRGLQGHFQNYIRDFSWNDGQQPMSDHLSIPPSEGGFLDPQPFLAPSEHSWPELCHRPPILNRPTNQPMHCQPPRVKPSRLTRDSTITLPSRKLNGQPTRKTIRKPRNKTPKNHCGKPARSGVWYLHQKHPEVWMKYPV